MYTQCPECEVAFSVTAEVLKQAAGKVRCGGCGVAFNALAHLSEETPVAPVAPITEDPPPHPLEVESDAPGELEAGTPPKSISAQQSAALLKTLDQLAGEDIRIEDTGVEWRVINVDEDEDDEFAADPVPSMVHQEMRFDDNTPLPDDFDLDAPSAPQLEAVAVVPEPTPSLEDSQVDLAFGEADEWEDLLDDLEEAAVSASIADETAEDAVAETDISAVLAALPDVIEIGAPETAEEEEEEPLDMDSQFALQAEEMGIDLSGVHAVGDEDVDVEANEVEAVKEEEPAEEEEKRETSIDEDLIAAAFEVEAAAKSGASDEIEPDEINWEDVDPSDLSRAGILDEDDYLEVITAEDELAEDAVRDELLHEDALEDRVLEQALMEEEVSEEEVAEEALEEETPEEDLSDDEAALEADLEQALEGLIEDSVDVDIALSEFTEPEQSEIPEPTEAERTLNMAIDQDLLAIAVEDDDGFTSTVVLDQISGAHKIPDEKKPANHDVSDQDNSDREISDEETSDMTPTDAALAAAALDDNPLMETIIMEGESVHNEEELERLEAAHKAAALSLKESGFDKDKDNFRNWQPPPYSMAAAAALLFVILVVQVIHNSRQALAVSPTFQNTIGPVYRMVGSPVTPGWDIKGWRFEATKGSTDDDDQVLTIYSRVGNNSDQTLPYPLVHVSLLARSEKIIGSRVLEPSEYLFDNADPRRPVRPGETFNAVIAIDSPSSDATGFKLNVCYRLASGQLRCAIEDFK
jgi:predicted Zn finger-like uncharacterized protein